MPEFGVTDRRIYEFVEDRGFARHLICDLASADCPNILRALRRFRWEQATGVERLPRPLHLVSVLAPHLRHRLEETLAVANVDWSCDTFPRSSLDVADHALYKSLAILQILETVPTNADVYLLGGHAAADVRVLLAIRLFTAGVLSVAGYGQFLRSLGVDKNICSFLARIGLRKTIKVWTYTSTFPSSSLLAEYLTVIDGKRLEKEIERAVSHPPDRQSVPNSVQGARYTEGQVIEMLTTWG